MFPSSDQVNFDNPIVGFEYYPEHRFGVNPIMKNGEKSNLKNKFVNVSTLLPNTDVEVSKVVIFC